jgi:hypothetical protein
MNARKDKFFQMRVDEQFLQRLDDFRRAAPDLPTRTEMARRLIEMAFDLAGKQQKAAPPLTGVHALLPTRRPVSRSDAKVVSLGADEGTPHREKRIRGRL